MRNNDLTPYEQFLKNKKMKKKKDTNFGKYLS